MPYTKHLEPIGTKENSSSMTTQKQKKTATVRNPSIEAVVKQLLRLPSEEMALKKMAGIRSHFVVSKQHIEQSDTPNLMLWIKGFEVSKAELKEGYLGHFAVIAPKKLPDDRWTLTATKIEFELAKHPQRKYQAKKQRHPNWGHPLLRKIKKGISDLTLEEGVAMLMKLHEEYPDASIPGELKLYLMIYKKADKGEKPITKWVFEMVDMVESPGLYRITCATNEPSQKPATAAKAPAANQEVLGKFTAKAIMKKKRK